MLGCTISLTLETAVTGAEFELDSVLSRFQGSVSDLKIYELGV